MSIQNIFDNKVKNYGCDLALGEFVMTDAPVENWSVVAIYDSGLRSAELIKLEKIDRRVYRIVDPLLFAYTTPRLAIVEVATDVEIRQPGEYSFIYVGCNPAGAQSFIAERGVLRFDLCRHMWLNDCKVQSTDTVDVPGNRSVFLRYSHDVSFTDVTIIGKHPVMAHRARNITISECSTELSKDSIIGHGTGSTIDVFGGAHHSIESGSGDPLYVDSDDIRVEGGYVQHLKCVGPSSLRCVDVKCQTLLGISTPWGDPDIYAKRLTAAYPASAIEGDPVGLVSHPLENGAQARGTMVVTDSAISQAHPGPGRKCVRAVLDREYGHIAMKYVNLHNANGSEPIDIQYV